MPQLGCQYLREEWQEEEEKLHSRDRSTSLSRAQDEALANTLKAET